MDFTLKTTLSEQRQSAVCAAAKYSWLHFKRDLRSAPDLDGFAVILNEAILQAALLTAPGHAGFANPVIENT